MRKISATMAACAAAVSLIGVGGGVAIAESQTAFACTIRTDPPNAGNNAKVGREGCANQIPGEGYIIEERDRWPDDDVGYEKIERAGVEWVWGSCENGRGGYYSEFYSSSGAYGNSAIRTRCSG